MELRDEDIVIPPTLREKMRTALLADLGALVDIFWDRVAGMDPAH